MQLANSSSLLVPRLVIKNKMVLPNGLGSRYDPLHFQFDPCSSWARITSMQHFSKLQRSSSQVLHCPFNQHQALPCLWLPLRRHCWSLRVMRSEFSTLFDTPEQSSTWYSRYLLWISRESRWLVGLLCLQSLAFRSLATVASTKNPLLHWPTTTPCFTVQFARVLLATFTTFPFLSITSVLQSLICLNRTIWTIEMLPVDPSTSPHPTRKSTR